MSDSNSGGGLGISGVATIVLVTLKLAQVDPVAGWSWFFVFGPLFVVLVIWSIIFVIVGGVLGAGAAGAGASTWLGRRQMAKLNRLADEQEAKERKKR